MKLSSKRRKMFEAICQAHGISNDEVEICQLLKSYYKDLADDIIYDNLGSIYAVKKCGEKDAMKVMIAAHMDEVGFRVNKIYEDGTIGVTPIGGVWEQVIMTQRVTIRTNKGKKIKGVFGSIPPHRLTPELRAKPFQIKDMHVDIGCSSKKQVEDLGVNLNDGIVMDGEFVELGDGSRLLSKAWDNRYGCIMGVELLQALKNVALPYDLYVGADVQEEMGLRGAGTAVNMIKPDFAIVLDCSPSNDQCDAKEPNGALGKGVLNRYFDGSMIAFPSLLEWQRKMCDKCKVDYQYYMSLGGTDAGRIHQSLAGVLTLTQCICARNIHTSASIIDLNDYEASKKVLLAMLKTLNKDLLEKFKNDNR